MPTIIELLSSGLPWFIILLIILIVWSKIQNQKVLDTVNEIKEMIGNLTTTVDE